MSEAQDKPADRRIIAVVSDLFFGSRINASARAAGAACVIARDANGLERALAAGSVDLVIVDLSLAGEASWECLRRAASMAPESERVAFYSHVHHELPARAAKAGATRVLPHSKFVVELEAMVRRNATRD